LRALYLDLQICVSVVDRQDTDLDSDDGTAAAFVPRPSAPPMFTTDMTAQNKMDAIAGTLQLLAPEEFKQQIDKNSPAVVAKRQKIIDDKAKVCVFNICSN
jgi:hypothetical protein